MGYASLCKLFIVVSFCIFCFSQKIVSSLNEVKEKGQESEKQMLKPVSRLVSCMESIHKVFSSILVYLANNNNNNNNNNNIFV